MTRQVIRLAAVIGLALAAACFGSSGALCGELDEGQALFMRYCASCHGTKADGRGPVARTLKEQPTDLTKLAEKFGSPLPAGQIARFVDGRDHVPAHGEREMPVWGKRFADISEAKGGMDERIKKIVSYLNSIQQPSHLAEPPPKPVSDRR